MLYSTKIKIPFLILLTFLVLAITSPYALLAGEGFGYANLDMVRASAAYFSSTTHAAEWLAEDAATISEANGYSSSVPHNWLLRIIAFVFVYFAARCFARSYFLLIRNDKTKIYKNNILLKLRI